MKLGKLAKKVDSRTLMFAKYVDMAALLPTIPSAYDWTSKVQGPWGMMLNDVHGDCTCAAAGHMIMSWTADNGEQYSPVDSQILDAYAAVSGFNPQTGENDNGAVEINVLNYWRNTGIAGHKIGSFLEIDPKNIDHIKAAIYLFGGVYTGFGLPLTARGQSKWIVTDPALRGPAYPGSWGGHAVPIMGFDSDGFTVITWGHALKADWDFLTYCDEMYVLISPDFVSGVKAAPNGFSMDQLNADVTALAA